MSKLDKQALLEKEKRLRKELNDASDEVEQQVLKAVGIALVSGLVVWGIYKLLAPSSEEKSSEKKKKSRKGTSNIGSTLISRLINAVLPMIISQIGPITSAFMQEPNKKGPKAEE